MKASIPARLRSALLSRSVARQIVMLAIAAIALYFLWPALARVLTAWPGLRALELAWIPLVFLFQLISFMFLWALFRIALRGEGWMLAATSQMSQLAVSRLVPGGAAAGSALQLRMLVKAGVNPTRGVYAITTVTLLSNGTLLVLPVLSLPAILSGVDAHQTLVQIGILGGVLFVATAAVVAAVLVSEWPVRTVGRALQWARNRVRRSMAPLTGLDDHLIAERDLILEVLGERWKLAVLAAFGRPFFEFLALLASLAAVGADISPALVLLAYVVAGVLTQVPLTPGGVGFVEAGLVATLGLAGVGGGDATAGALIFRLVTYWLPIPAGLGAYVLYRRRYGHPEDSDEAPETAGTPDERPLEASGGGG